MRRSDKLPACRMSFVDKLAACPYLSTEFVHLTQLLVQYDSVLV